MLESDCVRVVLDEAEEAIRALRAHGLLTKARPQRSGNFLNVPVKDYRAAIAMLESRGVKADPCRGSFEERPPASLPEDIGLSGYVKMGGIIVFSHARGVPFEAYVKAAVAVGAMYKDVESVFLKVGTVGELRLPQLVLLYGSGSTTTRVRENGLTFIIDVAKTYFNPKLALERLRIAREVSDGEQVLDMFAGVGPFSITLASRSACDVLSVDVNPYAVYLMAKNIELNSKRLKGRVHPLLADSYTLADHIDGEFDRVIMNNPTSVTGFIKVACSLSSGQAKLHVYILSPSQEDALRSVMNTAQRVCKGVKVVQARRALDYSPSKFIYSVDIIVSR
ncbi:MAG: class I SAM-dependent methyltransferase [Acidilobus sp.]